MDKYGLIGFPLGHSFSRGFFTEKFAREGIDAEYVNFEIPDASMLLDVIRDNPGLRGLNVTLPHKQAVIPLLDELSDENFIVLGKRTSMREITDHIFESSGFSPHTSFESDNPGTIRGLVAAGLGVSLWPEATWGRLETDKAKLVHLSDPVCHRNIYVTCEEHAALSDQTRLFIEFLTEYFRKLLTSH